MNYTFFKLCIAFCLLTATGCRKDFLEVSPQGQLTEELALRDPEAAEKLVGGVYNTLYSGGFGRTTVGFLWFTSLDVASDDADKGSSPGDFNVNGLGDIDNFIHTPGNSIFNNIWLGHYSAITVANRAIDILNQSTIDANRKNKLLGEARFLRALYYFNLVRYFGGVPKIDRVIRPDEANSDFAQTRASRDEIYALIISDLDFAAANLPMKGQEGAVIGRVTKGTAQSYLSKVYLYRKDYQKSLDNAAAVINSGRYSLVSNYATIFRERQQGGPVPGGNNNAESIFEVQTGVNATQNGVSQLFSNGQGPRGKGGWNDLGFGFNVPTTDLVNSYEASDMRREGSIIFINSCANNMCPGSVLWDGFRIPSQDSVENPRYNYKAYHSPIAESGQLTNSKDDKPKNIRLMRYAEVLLIYAEAAANLNNATEATAKLNMVRERANLGAVPGTVENIWKERRNELALEADRFFDLVRQGRAGQVLRAHGKPFVDNKHEVFPIPQPQIDLSGNRLTQNPNY
jgi:tetratricopeptide (TPR) repeat protein